jgi:16S rRNA (cytosine1402-N4)-methyltransferase
MIMTRRKQIPGSTEAANPAAYHLPVLLQESIDGLQVRSDGIYVDCTFGGGGHSREILKRLGGHGRLFAFDQDAEAAMQAPQDPRLEFIPSNFRHMQRFLRLHKVTQVDGILADLGVSSHQFDEASRGFSTRFEGDLDMRMDRRQTLTATGIVNQYSEQQLHKLFEKYGELSNAKTLAKLIIHQRKSNAMRSTSGFMQAIAKAVVGNPNKWYAQVFQALRIEVNDELGALKEMLQQVSELLKPGGRIAVITFHSLEDRIVKSFFKKGFFDEQDDQDDQDPFGQKETKKIFKVITRKPIAPAADEIKKNSRSRSARLRIAEKI